MSINNAQIKAAAHLARLTINKHDEAATTSTISQILELVDKMQTVDTHDVKPMAHPLDAVQRLRADEVTEVDEREHLQRHAPAIEEGLFLVPRVIE
ncbi:MAG: Asp-tRNA(Asn)/Glu-tRNA(Gln) amidotransferase subunit GatC [Endozoicomonas sp. (ex Botrylloides leachii)]|nr:Asp-tRNA(Asn)/Glu-tRNA(Gln) amidotransferase subunit GatC [Endozoicomonas sp. (ex Botrylloides leachii)]